MSLRKYIKNTADKVFSQYIRAKGADRHGYCKCITCGKREHWKDMDAGHYVTRARWGTRFDEDNVFPQCRRCNRFEEGRKPEFTRYLRDRYDSYDPAADGNIVDSLIIRSNRTKTFTLDELKEWVKDWRAEIKKMYIVKSL